MITKEEMENVTASVSINIIVININSIVININNIVININNINININNIVIIIIIAMGPKYTKADIWWILRRK